MNTDSSDITLLSNEWVLVATNSGTYGAAEAARKCGTGDPRFADHRIYERVGGGKRHEGMDLDRMPGRLRSVGREALKAKRQQLQQLIAERRSAINQTGD